MSTDIDLVFWDLAQFDPAQLDFCAKSLSPDEIARAARFANTKDQVLYITAHYLLRRVLSDHAPIDPRAWHFATGAHGKPYLTNAASGLTFNLTHTGGLVAVAVAQNIALGIDAENLDRRVNINVADHRFSAIETEWLRSLPEEEQGAGFLRLWTLKEAFLKAIGKGLSKSLSSFTVLFDPLRLAMESPEPGWPVQFQLYETCPTPHHQLALAVPQSGLPRKINLRNFDLR